MHYDAHLACCIILLRPWGESLAIVCERIYGSPPFLNSEACLILAKFHPSRASITNSYLDADSTPVVRQRDFGSAYRKESPLHMVAVSAMRILSIIMGVGRRSDDI